MYKIALLFLYFGSINAKPQGLTEVITDKLFGNDCLKKVLNPDTCAFLYDDDGCEGWEEEIKRNTDNLKLPFLRRNDAEAVIVKRGCIMIGYDDHGSSRAARGRSVLFDARDHNKEFIHKDLDSDTLNDDIESVDCFCGSEIPAEYGGESGIFTGRDVNSNVRDSKCPQSLPASVCAIVYEEDDCENGSFSPLTIHDKESRSFSLTKSPTNFKYKNNIEAFIVRSGCTLELFKDSDFSDDHIRAQAVNGNLAINLDDHPNQDFDDMKNDAESLRCNCNY